MMHDTLEIIDSFHSGNISLGSKSNSGYKPPSHSRTSIITSDSPFVCDLIESSGFDILVVFRMFGEFDFGIDMIKVST
jgi:hypothetical protein